MQKYYCKFVFYVIYAESIFISFLCPSLSNGATTTGYNHPNWIEGNKRCANSTADLPGTQGVLMQWNILTFISYPDPDQD